MNGKTPHPPSSVGHLPGERAIIFGARRSQEDCPLPRGEGGPLSRCTSSGSGPGEGLIRRDSRLRLKHSQPHCSVRPQVSSKRLQSNRSEWNSATQFANPGSSSSPASVLSQKFDHKVLHMRAVFSQPRQGRKIVAQGASPGARSPHPAFGTPLPLGRERGRGRGRVRIPTADAVGYILSPAPRAELFNELLTQDTSLSTIHNLLFTIHYL